MANDLKHVQLTSADFTGDSKFVAWPARERGAYCSLIFYLYQNGGKLAFDEAELGPLCGCHDCFAEVWQNISGKFQLDGTFIKHKRVTAELRRARAFRQAKRRAGLVGASKRWQNHSGSNGTAIAKVREGKVREGKVKEEQKKKHTSPAGDLPVGFLNFWKAYPRPRAAPGRKRHQKDCLTLWHKEGYEAIVDTILEGLESCKDSPQWTKDAGEFIPAPLPWLRSAPWPTVDELEDRNKRKQAIEDARLAREEQERQDAAAQKAEQERQEAIWAKATPAERESAYRAVEVKLKGKFAPTRGTPAMESCAKIELAGRPKEL